MRRVGTRVGVTIEHPRKPAESRAFLWSMLEGKREDMVYVPLTERQCFKMAEELLGIGNTLARLREERTQ